MHGSARLPHTYPVGDYDLDRLGPAEFENLTQALALKVFGVGVRVYGAGRDGGRDATSRHRLDFPDGSIWDGYTVIQAKFRHRQGDPTSNARWLRNEIRKELASWSDPLGGRQAKPENILFVTNVILSAVPDRGLDQVETVFDDFHKRLPLARRAIWHYDHLCRLLDDAPAIRNAFAGLITPGDVLSNLHRTLEGSAVDLGGLLRRHAAKELLAEQWVRLGQAGSKGNEKLLLGQVAVELAAERLVANDKLERIPAVDHVLSVGNSVLRRSVRPDKSPHMVLVGGPGQGKTTVSQLVCQAYRVALLEDGSEFGPEVESALATLRQHLASLGLALPVARRWPLRIDLSRFADALAGGEGISLLKYMASLVSDRAEDTITGSQLHTWLRAWPWLIVLDGMDEVAASHLREVIVERVSDLLVDAASLDADLLLIATTRPRGYAGEFTPDRYEHLTLAELGVSEALNYARKLADVRHSDDPDMHRNVLERMTEAAAEDLTARLMRTPLQVTIMSLLLEGRPRVPQHRHGLFEAYYETIYNREVGKPGSTGRLLEQHRRTINALHEQVGLLLQKRAEGVGQAEPILSQAELRTITYGRLISEEFSESDAHKLSEKIVRAATDRLVLLVPKEEQDLGFEVRSLQEFMAARALLTGSDVQIMHRLEILATSSHWRNTWLLAAGRLAALRDHLIDGLIAMLGRIDADDYLMVQLAPGADLAIDLLDDGFASNSPRVERLLLKQAVETLRKPLDVTTTRAADSLQRVSLEGSDGAAAMVADVALQALSGDPPQKVTAAVMLQRWSNSSGTLATLGKQRVPSLKRALGSSHYAAYRLHFLAFSADRNTPRTRRLGTMADPFMGANDLQESDREALQRLMEGLRRIPVESVETMDVDVNGRLPVAVVSRLGTVDQDILDRALSREGVADFVAGRMLSIGPREWAMSSALTVLFRDWLQRRPVADALP